MRKISEAMDKLDLKGMVWAEIRTAISPQFGMPDDPVPHPIWDKIRFLCDNVDYQEMRMTERIYEDHKLATKCTCQGFKVQLEPEFDAHPLKDTAIKLGKYAHIPE